MNLDVLYIVPYVPNLIRVRPFNLIRNLSARGIRVTVLTVCANEHDWEDVRKIENEVYHIEAVKVSRLKSVSNCIRSLPSSVPLQASFSWSEALAKRVQRLQIDADIVHTEHLRGARYALYARSKRGNSTPPVIWDSVDCISHLFEQAAEKSQSFFGRFMSRLELPRTRRYEAWLISMFDRVLVTSAIDKEKLEELHFDVGEKWKKESEGDELRNLRDRNPNSKIVILRNGVDLDYFSPTYEPRNQNSIVFCGKMSYHANVTACLYLVEQVMPRIWKEYPHARLTIVGKDPPKKIKDLALRFPGKIDVTGTVPDVRPYVRRASLAVLPIVYGAGCQNKILEAMACETPVVTVPQAVSCFDVVHNRDVVIADTPEQIARMAVRLLRNTQHRLKIGQAGRRYVKKNHRWSDIAGDLEEIYRETLNHSP